MKTLLLSFLMFQAVVTQANVTPAVLAQLIDHLDFEYRLIELHRECKQGKRIKCVENKLFHEKVGELGNKTRYEHLQTVIGRLEKVVSFFDSKEASSLDLQAVKSKLQFFKSVRPGMELKGKSLTFTNYKQDIVDALYVVRADYRFLVRQKEILGRAMQKLATQGQVIETVQNVLTENDMIRKSPFKAGEFTINVQPKPTISFAFLEVNHSPIYLLKNVPFKIEYQRNQSYLARVSRGEHKLEFHFVADESGELDPSRMIISVIRGDQKTPLKHRLIQK